MLMYDDYINDMKFINVIFLNIYFDRWLINFCYLIILFYDKKGGWERQVGLKMCIWLNVCGGYRPQSSSTLSRHHLHLSTLLRTLRTGNDLTCIAPHSLSTCYIPLLLQVLYNIYVYISRSISIFVQLVSSRSPSFTIYSLCTYICSRVQPAAFGESYTLFLLLQFLLHLIAYFSFFISFSFTLFSSFSSSNSIFCSLHIHCRLMTRHSLNQFYSHLLFLFNFLFFIFFLFFVY